MGQMGRRQFVVGAGAPLLAVGGCLPAPRAAAQPARRPFRIGLVPDFGPPFWASNLKIMTEVLAEAGKVEGRDFVYIHSGINYGPETDLALERVLQAKPDLMVTGNLGYAVSAHKRTQTIPVVMFIAGFPVEGGVADSLVRPGRNVTGTVIYAGGEVFGKLVQFVHDVKPGMKRIGALQTYVPPFHPRLEADVVNRGMRDAARSLGLDLRLEEAGTPEQIDAALAKFARDGVEALVLTGGPSSIPRRGDILRRAIERRLPTIADTNWTYGGDIGDLRLLLAYPPDFGTLMRQATDYVYRILWQGADPAVLPIQLPARFSLMVHLKTARAIGLSVPQSILTRADQIIE